jgi:alpha-mannosidase
MPSRSNTLTSMCCEPLFVLAIATRLTAEPTLSQTGLGFQAYVVSHTHSDFAWADSIAGCLDKNVAAVAKSVELAEKYPDFRFCMEHMLAVREYLRRNPDKLETVRKLMEEGRFEAGGLFTGPWELTSGAEGLVRQLYLGKLWVKKNLGVDALTVWNVDVAGHTAQMPQILSKAGIKGLVISAGSEGPNLLRWQARDGSSVLTWRTLWGYGAGATLGLRNQDLTQTLTNMPRFMAELTRNTEEYHLPKIAFIADGTDLQSPTELVVENIRLWNAQNRYPPVTYSSTAAAFAAVEKATIATASGEMPSPWDSVQSQGNECFMLDRQLDGRVLAAEKLAAFDSVVDPSFSYPSSSFDEVWYERLYTFDHNWGGSHG